MTDFTKANLDIVIPDMDRQRQALHLSYQAVADACGVSQSSIMRVFKRQVEPTFDLLQKIAAAVHYEPTQPEVILPSDNTTEAYIEYLKKLVTKQRGDYERQLLQQEARHNMLQEHYRRIIRILCVVLGVFFAAFILFRAFDMRISNEPQTEICDACYAEIVKT